MTKSIVALLDERRHGAARDLASGFAEDVADEEDPHVSRPARECGCSRRGAPRCAAGVTRNSPARSVASRAAAVEGAGQPHRPREPPERALGDVKGGAAWCSQTRRQLAAHDDERVARERPRTRRSAATPGRSMTISIAVGGFDDVEGRRAFGARPCRSGARQIRQPLEARRLQMLVLCDVAGDPGVQRRCEATSCRYSSSQRARLTAARRHPEQPSAGGRAGSRKLGGAQPMLTDDID